VTAGIISAKERDVDPESQFQHFLQTDAAIITPATAAGPLLNIRGEVIGINTASLRRPHRAAIQGVGFAMPMNMARRVYNQIIQERKYARRNRRLVCAVGYRQGPRAAERAASAKACSWRP